MKISSDYRDLLSIFNAAGVRYVIVGGYAVMIHTEPRYTKDLDIWVDRSDANAQALFKALARMCSARDGSPVRGAHAPSPPVTSTNLPLMQAPDEDRNVV